MKEIKLSGGQIALVDDDDFERLSQFKWHFDGRYARRNINGSSMLLHREVMNTPDGYDTDHVNHNTLDNRRCNLRICTRGQNNHNQIKRKYCSSNYKGVTYFKFGKRIKRWKTQIKINNKETHVGYYMTQEEAAMAYNNKAKEHFGEFALLNNICAVEAVLKGAK